MRNAEIKRRSVRLRRPGIARRFSAAGGGQEVLSVKFDADEAAANRPGGDECGPRSAEWIKDDAVRFTERANERFQCLGRLLRRMKAVSRVRKIHHIRERIG